MSAYEWQNAPVSFGTLATDVAHRKPSLPHLNQQVRDIGRNLSFWIGILLLFGIYWYPRWQILRLYEYKVLS